MEAYLRASELAEGLSALERRLENASLLNKDAHMETYTLDGYKTVRPAEAVLGDSQAKLADLRERLEKLGDRVPPNFIVEMCRCWTQIAEGYLRKVEETLA